MEDFNDLGSVFTPSKRVPRDPSTVIKQAAANNKTFDPATRTFVEKPDDYGFTDSWSAFRQEGSSLTEFVMRDMAVDAEADADFRFSDEVMDTYFKDTPEPFHEYMFEAESQAELDQRMEQVKITQHNQSVLAENLGDSTFTTLLAMLGSSIISEENAALMAIPVAGQVATGVRSVANVGKGINTAVNAVRSAATGATRLGSAVRGAALGGVQGGAEGLYAHSVLPDYTAQDVMVDVAFTGLFGSVLSGATHQISKHADDYRANELLSASAAGGIPQVPAIRNSLEAPESDFKAPSIDEIASPEQGKTAWGTRWVSTLLSQGAFLRASKNKITRNFSRILVQDNRVNNGGGANVQAASTIQTQTTRSARVKLARVMEPEYRKWAMENKGFVSRKLVKARDEFETLVTRAVRNDDFYNKAPESVQKAADNARKVFSDLLEEKKRFRVKGAKDVEYNRNYVPTDWDSRKLRQTIKDVGGKPVSKIIGQAIARQNGWNLAFSTRLAEKFTQKVASLDTGIHGSSIEDVFDDMDELKRWLRKEGLTKAEIDEGMGVAMKKKNKETHPDVNMRQRLDMDYDTVFSADGVHMSVGELLNNNMTDIVQNYSFKAGRHIGFARNGIGGEGMDTFDQALGKLKKQALAQGLDAEETAKEITHIESLMKGLKGSELINDTSLGLNRGKYKGLQMGRNMTYLAYSSYFGLMSVIEAANIVAYGGFKTLFKVIPEHQDWLKAARNGEIGNEDLQDLIDATGVGTHGLTGSGSTRIDEIGGMMEHTDPYWQRARQVQGIITGLTPLTDFLQRLDLAVMRKKWIQGDIPKAMRQDTGISDAMYKRIKDQIAKHGDGKRTLNYKKWDDVEARDAFTAHLSIEIRNNVQETDLGSTNHLLRNQVGSTVGQFLSFVSASQEQQWARMNRRAVNGMAMETAYVVMGQMLMASLITTARTYNQAEGRSDKREYLKEHLSPEGIALATLGYTGVFGVLGMITQIPDKVSRGLGSGSVSNPLVGYVDGIGQLVHTLATDGKISETEARSIMHMIPMLTQVYTHAALNQLANDIGD